MCYTSDVLKSFLFFLILLSSHVSLAQQNIRELLSNAVEYEETVKLAEDYFTNKYPTLSRSQLSSGEFRDGDFVKYMRWKRFWQNHLNEKKTHLGNIPAELAKASIHKNQSLSVYSSIPWTNISYSDYIVGQIGLGRTTSMAFHPTDPNIFYVGAAIGGIWKTIDGGQSYTPLGDELPFMAVSSIVVDQQNPQTIYIAISDHVWYGPPGIGIYKSTDGGLTWNPTSLSFSFTDNIRIYWLQASIDNPNTLFVATADGLFKTDDGFSTHTKVISQGCFDVKPHPSNNNIIYAGSLNGQFLKSVDGGSSFNTTATLGSNPVFLGISLASPGRVYARHSSTLHKSYDEGQTFTETSNFAENNEVFVLSPLNADIIVSGNFETYQSDNNGINFTKTMNWLGNNNLPEVHVDQRNMYINPLENDKAYYCNDGGLYRYSISSKTFENLSNGLKITQYYDIATAQTDPVIIGGGSQDNGNMFREADGVWDDYASTGDGMNQEIDPTDANTRYWAYQQGALRRWVNGTNTQISPPGQNGNGAWETPFRLDETNPSRIIAGYTQVYESLDKGETWSIISSNLAGSNLEEIAISKSNPDRIYATNSNQLFVKEISGNTWVTKSMPSGGLISDIEVDPLDMNTLYISVPGYSQGSKVYRSLDAGDSWINISGTLPNVSIGAIELYQDVPEGIFVGTDVGVFYRDVNTNDWLEYGDLPNTRVEDIEIQYSIQKIRVGTHGRGIFEADIEIESCMPTDPDADNDGICDLFDTCPNLDDTLIGQACEDGNPDTSGETYSMACLCEGGISNLSYCNAMGSAGTGADWINRVRLNTLDHSSTKTSYSDFKIYRTTLDKGINHTLTVSLNYSFPLDEVYAWIDFDRNGVFDATDLIPMSPINRSIHESIGNFSIPMLSSGITTMRVRVIYADPNTAEPCQNYFGEVEDYTIDIGCYQNFDNANTLMGIQTVDEKFETDGIIRSVQNINNNSDVIYDSKQAIILDPVFEIVSGAIFHAFIDGCGGQ